MNRTKHIFLSYSHTEDNFALKLTADLKNAGVNLWMDHFNILAGMTWPGEIEQAIDNCAAMIAVLSPAYVKSRYCQNELLRAVEREVPIFPVLLSTVALPFVIQQVQYEDFRDWQEPKKYSTRFDKLLARLKTDAVEQVGIVPNAETRYLTSLIAELEASRGVLQYVTLSGQMDRSSDVRPQPFAGREWVHLEELVARQTQSSESEIRGSRELQEDKTPLANVAEAVDKHPRFVLIGDPGAGKTTMIRNHALDVARKRLQQLAPIPLLLYLPQWDEEKTPTEFVQAHWKLGNDPIEMLKRGEILLYLDGLNEMGGKGPERAKMLQEWFASPDAPAHTIVTCRAEDYAGNLKLGETPIVTVQELSKTQIEQFVEAYLPNRKDAFLTRILPKNEENQEAARSLLRLARNPFMLVALMFVYEEGGDLPRNPGALFRALAQELWDRETKLSMTGGIPFGQAEAAFGQLAFAMIDEGESVDVPVTYAIQKLGDESLMRAGISASYLQRNGDQIRFYHQLFEEYFAATHLQIVKLSPAYSRSIFKAFGKFISFLTDPLLGYRRLMPFHFGAALRYLGLLPRSTMLRSVAHNRHRFYSNRSTWNEVIISLCGIDDDPDGIVQHITEVNPYLAIQCVKSGVKVSGVTHTHIVNILKEYLIVDNYDYYDPLMLLGDLGTDQATDEIRYFFKKSKNNSDRREHAVQALGKTKNPIVNSDLLAALRDEDDEVRWFAALALGKMGVTVIPDLLIIFEEAPSIHGGATTALERAGKTAIPYIVERLNHPNIDIELQRGLVSLLVKLPPDSQSIPVLVRIMHDRDEKWRSVRQDVVDRLSTLAAVTELSNLLETLDDWAMKMRITGKLRKIGTPEAVEAAEAWLNSQR